MSRKLTIKIEIEASDMFYNEAWPAFQEAYISEVYTLNKPSIVKPDSTKYKIEISEGGKTEDK